MNLEQVGIPLHFTLYNSMNFMVGMLHASQIWSLTYHHVYAAESHSCPLNLCGTMLASSPPNNMQMS